MASSWRTICDFLDTMSNTTHKHGKTLLIFYVIGNKKLVKTTQLDFVATLDDVSQRLDVLIIFGGVPSSVYMYSIYLDYTCQLISRSTHIGGAFSLHCKHLWSHCL